MGRCGGEECLLRGLGDRRCRHRAHVTGDAPGSAGFGSKPGNCNFCVAEMPSRSRGDALGGGIVGAQEACEQVQEWSHDPSNPTAPVLPRIGPRWSTGSCGTGWRGLGSTSVAPQGCEFTSKVASEGFQKGFCVPYFTRGLEVSPLPQSNHNARPRSVPGPGSQTRAIWKQMPSFCAVGACARGRVAGPRPPPLATSLTSLPLLLMLTGSLGRLSDC